jgi:hypothetical protein
MNTLLIGTTNTLSQGVRYTLPSRVVFIKSNQLLDASFDNTNWVRLTDSLIGTQCVYPFVRCSVGNAVVIIKTLKPNKLTGSYNPPAADVSTPTSFWNLEEATGATRIDSVGGNNLTSNNGVTQVPGKIGYAAGFNGVNQYLSILNNSSFNATGSLSLCAWIYPLAVNSSGNGWCILGQWQRGTSGDRAYNIELIDSNVPQFTIRNSANSANQFVTTTAATLNTWNFVVGVFDNVGKTVNISINGATFASTSATGGVRVSSTTFNLGAHTATDSFPYNGYIDMAGFWNGYALTQADVTYLYNNGNGIQWPF